MNRRWVLAAALVAVVGLAVGLAFVLRSQPGPGVPRPLTASTQVGGLNVAVPRGFQNYPLNGHDVWTPGVGHVLTNFDLPSHRTIGWVLHRWQAAQSKFIAVKKHNYGPASNEVALELSQPTGPVGCIGGPCPPPIPLRLPLGPDQPWDQERLANGAPGYRSGYLRLHHEWYYVRFWIGPDAPANDRAAVLEALRSIRPAT